MDTPAQGKHQAMLRKLLFGAAIALALLTGAFMPGTVSENAVAAPMMSTATHIDMTANVLDVRQNCGPWNNYCRPSIGGGNVGGCVTVGGVRFCMGTGGTNCHWYNGVRYCNNDRPVPPPAARCIRLNNHLYCSYKHRADCVRVNRQTYCRF